MPKIDAKIDCPMQCEDRTGKTARFSTLFVKITELILRQFIIFIEKILTIHSKKYTVRIKFDSLYFTGVKISFITS